MPSNPSPSLETPLVSISDHGYGLDPRSRRGDGDRTVHVAVNLGTIGGLLETIVADVAQAAGCSHTEAWTHLGNVMSEKFRVLDSQT